MSRRTGTADLPLHGGRAPPWLFERMSKLAPAIVEAIVLDHGPATVLERLSDPHWFQAFGCVLGFDWHSSGVTTTVCGALKAGLAEREVDTGLYVAGGKGAASRKTPDELRALGSRLGLDAGALVYNSRMAAKVDSAAVQDGFQIYQHAFFLTSRGEWAVVQQGMRDDDGSARRYHWLGARVSDFVCEPHVAISSDAGAQYVLNLVAEESAGARAASAALAREAPARVAMEAQRIARLRMPGSHAIDVARDVSPKHLHRILVSTYEAAPRNFEELLGLPGIGVKAVRAFALIAELAYGQPASVRDPARFSFAHGGKDGHPFPVDRETYDRSIVWLRTAVDRARMGHTDRVQALKRLAVWERETSSLSADVASHS